MNAAAGCELLGRWRIVEADLWDRDYLDLVEPAYMTFAKNGRGEFAFGVVNATMELGYGQRIVFFNWTGIDEGDEICGFRLSRTRRRRYHRNRAVLPQRR
jgi:hypothetical protein